MTFQQFVEALAHHIPEYDSFFKSIFTQPLDRTHLQVMSDWLEDNGEQRLAELIRRVAEDEDAEHKKGMWNKLKKEIDKDIKSLAKKMSKGGIKVISPRSHDTFEYTFEVNKKPSIRGGYDNDYWIVGVSTNNIYTYDSNHTYTDIKYHTTLSDVIATLPKEIDADHYARLIILCYIAASFKIAHDTDLYMNSSHITGRTSRVFGQSRLFMIMSGEMRELEKETTDLRKAVPALMKILNDNERLILRIPDKLNFVMRMQQSVALVRHFIDEQNPDLVNGVRQYPEGRNPELLKPLDDYFANLFKIWQKEF